MKQTDKQSAIAMKQSGIVAKVALSAGATRVLSAPPPVIVKTSSRAPLQKNAKFFPSETDATTSRRTTDKGISFDIAPPKDTAIASTKRRTTPVKKQTATHKVISPFKIARDKDDWAGKQCDTFVGWLNYTFHPDEDEDGDSASGLRALVMHRRLAQVRFRAAELFQSPTMRKIREAVQSEIVRDRLTIRADRDLHADLSLRELATQLLLSYTTPWLRLGLEVMYGECIVVQENLQDEGASGTVRPLSFDMDFFTILRHCLSHQHPPPLPPASCYGLWTTASCRSNERHPTKLYITARSFRFQCPDEVYQGSDESSLWKVRKAFPRRDANFGVVSIDGAGSFLGSSQDE